MNVDQALSRIKKCLALSASANEHEAAAAMRQAAALMRKFNLEYANVLASDASEACVRSRARSRPAQWEGFLVDTVARQFRSAIIMRRARGQFFQWVFVGTNHSAEVASYALTVLLRQAWASRAGFLAELPRGLKTGDKRQLGNRFSLGWVFAVHQAIREFAADSGDLDPAVRAYLDQQNLKKNARTKKITAKFDKADAYAFSLGAMSGKDARLYRGVGTEQEQQPLLL